MGTLWRTCFMTKPNAAQWLMAAPSFNYFFNSETGCIEPRFICAQCNEPIRNIQNGTLASPVSDDSWTNAVILHVDPCLLIYEHENDLSMGTFNLDDVVCWLSVNSLSETNKAGTEAFMAKLKHLIKAVEELVEERGGDINYTLPSEDAEPE